MSWMLQERENELQSSPMQNLYVKAALFCLLRSQYLAREEVNTVLWISQKSSVLFLQWCIFMGFFSTHCWMCKFFLHSVRERGEPCEHAVWHHKYVCSHFWSDIQHSWVHVEEQRMGLTVKVETSGVQQFISCNEMYLHYHRISVFFFIKEKD